MQTKIRPCRGVPLSFLFPNIASDTKTVMSDEQKIKAVDNSHCMKTEKECMAASAPTLGTFDIINSIDLESIISRVSSKTLNV